MNGNDQIEFNGMWIPHGLVDAVKDVSALEGFASWRKMYRDAKTLSDQLDLLAEIEVAYKLKRQSCVVTFHPLPKDSRGPDLDVTRLSQRLFFVEVKRIRYSAPEAEHKSLKNLLVNQLLQTDLQFGFDICFHRRLTPADEHTLLPRIIEYYKTVALRLSEDTTFHHREDRQFRLDHLGEDHASAQFIHTTVHESAVRDGPMDEMNELGVLDEPKIGTLYISRLEEGVVGPVYFGAGDLYNIYVGNECDKIRDDLLDGGRPKYRQLPADACGIIVVKADSDSHEADDVVAALFNAQQLHEYPNLSAIVLLSKWRKLNGGTCSEIIFNKHAQCPLTRQAVEILRVALEIGGMAL